jgi:tripartite-type tricarboxylate transporter receptor subunit TctC
MNLENLRFQRCVKYTSYAILISLMVFPSFSIGQEYPTKPIQIILTWPPGGGSPVLATMMAEEAKKYISKPVVIIYKPGASGTIGTLYAAQAKPDGYNLLVVRSGQLYAPLFDKTVGYSYREFESIGQIASTPGTLMVKQDAPWKTLKEFIAYAKNNPNVVTAGNPGTYSGAYLMALKFAKIAGVSLTHVPFLGGAPAMAALAGGHIACHFRFTGDSEALIDTGKVRVLTVFDSKRIELYPNAPTAKEEGINLEMDAWTGLMAPKGTPEPILKYWENFIEKLSRDKGFTEKVARLKMIYRYKNAGNFKMFIQEDILDAEKMARELVP